MAAETLSHRLPEDNRPSMDSIPGDDQRLLDTDPLYDDDESPPPKKGIFQFKLSYHPTFYTRLLVLCLFICAFSLYIASRHSRTIPAIIFLSFAIFRNIVVLYSHLIRRCFIRIHIEIVGRTSSASNSKPKKWCSSWFKHRAIQLVIDWALIILLTITTITAKSSKFRWYWPGQPQLIIPACVLCWVAIPIYALSTVDMGKPGRIRFTNAVSFDTGKENDDADDTIPPRTYRDVEASGGLQGDMTRKTGADSPPMI